MSPRNRVAAACLVGAGLLVANVASALWPFGSKGAAQPKPAPAQTAPPASAAPAAAPAVAPAVVEAPSPREDLQTQAEKLRKAFEFFRAEQGRMQQELDALRQERERLQNEVARLTQELTKSSEALQRARSAPSRQAEPASDSKVKGKLAEVETALESERRLRGAQEDVLKERDREIRDLKRELAAKGRDVPAKRAAKAVEEPAEEPVVKPAAVAPAPVAEKTVAEKPIEPEVPAAMVQPEAPAAAAPETDAALQQKLAAMSTGDLVTEANDLLQKGSVGEAEMRFAEAFKRDGNLLNAMLGLAACRYSYGDLDAASLRVDDILAKDPQYAEALGLKGIIAWRRGDAENAVATLNAAIGIQPDSAQLHNYMGIVLHAQEDLAGAETELLKAAHLDPKHVEARFNLAVIMATSVPPRLEEAKKYYEEALQLGSERNEMLEELLYP